VSTETRLPASDFDGQTCSAPEARTRRMAEIVLDHVDAATPIRMLDLGCGTGMLAFRLADALPSARITGLDISRGIAIASISSMRITSSTVTIPST
jgi:methylase of polypeptide subunit release factors